MTTTTKVKKPKKKPDPHVVLVPPATFACLHCGESYEMSLPSPVDLMTSAMRAFSSSHKACKAGAHGRACRFCFDFGHMPEECPDTKYNGSYQHWAGGPDTGMSSIAICKRLMPPRQTVTFQYHQRFDLHPHPLDPSDFGRCHRLLHAIPGWRARIGEMAAASEEWANLVKHWDELERLYLEELPTGAGPKLYARMRELGV